MSDPQGRLPKARKLVLSWQVVAVEGGAQGKGNAAAAAAAAMKIHLKKYGGIS